MFVVLKVEVKNNLNGELDYIDEEVVGTASTIEGASATMDTLADFTIAKGYFDKVISRGETYVNLTNGGTAYLKYCVRMVEED